MKKKEIVMDLIERYVHEVGRHLPRKNRSDIKAELQSTLVDTLEAQVGGEASQEDVIDLLVEYGPPERVAASYWSEGQYLIGPKLFPLFRMVVAIALSVFVIVQLVMLGVAVVFNHESLSVLEFFGEFIPSIFIAFGIIVMVFAVLQRFDVRPDTEQEEWDPRHLPAIEESESINRGWTVIEISVGLVIIAILLFLPDKIGVVLSPGMEFIFNPVIIFYIPLIILTMLLGIGLDVILLWRGRWETSTRIAKIATNLFGIYVLSVLITGHNTWLAQNGVAGFFPILEALPDGSTPSMEMLQIISMQAFRMAFVIALIVTVVDTINMAYRLVKRSIDNAASSPIIP
jgi:hypothetical protein